MTVGGISVIADPELSSDEIEDLVRSERRDWEAQGKEISAITMTLEGDEIVIQTNEKSPIQRVRRITGYLSNIENFNDAKRAECKDRFVHVKN